jgi:hypothetical protein
MPRPKRPKSDRGRAGLTLAVPKNVRVTKPNDTLEEVWGTVRRTINDELDDREWARPVLKGRE